VAWETSSFECPGLYLIFATDKFIIPKGFFATVESGNKLMLKFTLLLSVLKVSFTACNAFVLVVSPVTKISFWATFISKLNISTLLSGT